MPESVKLQVYRYRPESDPEPSWETFEVPVHSEWMILDALNYIKDHLDGSLSYRWACRMGVCGSCGMIVNGQPVLTCAKYLESLLPGPIRVEPLQGFPVIRDLVGDITDFMEKLTRVKPWIVRAEEKPLADGEYLQTPASIVCFATQPVRFMHLTLNSSGQPRSHWLSATTWTLEMRPIRNGWTSSHNTRVSRPARSWENVPRFVRKTWIPQERFSGTR